MTAYIDRRHIKADSTRRNPEGVSHSGNTDRFRARPDDPWIVNNTTRYLFQIGARPDKPPLKSGFNNVKIGKKVLKGRWAGMPIFTLTLTERATCGPCAHKLDCYGNAMLNAQRQQHGEPLLDRIMAQLKELEVAHPLGFVVRLHVLGDFYSVDYVRFWDQMLETFTGMRIYGYTARVPETKIGHAVQGLMRTYRFRVSIRVSDGVDRDVARTISIATAADVPKDGTIICPAQTEKTSHCGNCALCWDTDKRIAFIAH